MGTAKLPTDTRLRALRSKVELHSISDEEVI